MRRVRALFLRLAGFFRKGRHERELAAEMESHLQMHIEDNLRAGMSAAEARRQALIKLGGIEQTKEIVRDRRGPHVLEVLLQDLRFGARTLCKNPGFTGVAVLTLALGIGANTSLFSVVNAVILKPLPFPNPNQLVTLYESKVHFENGAISYPNFLDWQRDNRTFASMAAFAPTSFSLTGAGAADQISVERISAEFFSTLGVKPMAGRDFTPEEDRLGASPVALVGEPFWREKFGSAPDIVGRTITLDGASYLVIGIIPRSFMLQFWNFRASDVYVPIGQWNFDLFRTRNTVFGMNAIGRLKPGVTLAQARTDMDGVTRRLSAEYPEADKGIGASVIPLKARIVKDVESLLFLLMGSVGFVLLIACVNVANLFLARSTGRAREFAIRSALGAGRMRIVRQLLTESVLLALAGGALGLALAIWGVRAGVNLAVGVLPEGLPRADEIGIDARVLLFCLGVSLTVGSLFGLAPALKTGDPDLRETLSKAGRGTSPSRSTAQNVLVVSELAMALILLAGAGLMIRSLGRLWSVNPGFNTKNTATFYLGLAPSVAKTGPEEIRMVLQQVTDRIASVPGVESVALLEGSLPMQGDSEDPFWIEGRPKPLSDNDKPWALWYEVDPNYLNAMGIPLLRGRFFTREDSRHSRQVAVIDETFAAQYFPNEDPLGKVIVDDYKGPTEVVGVVGHAKHWGLDDKNALHAQMYFPFAQIRDKAMPMIAKGVAVILRSRNAPGAAFGSIRAAIAEMSTEHVIFRFSTMEETISATLIGRRTFMILLVSFAVLALLLATVGIYGVLSYLVTRQTHEIGIRLALGAQRGDVLRLILGEGMRTAAIGVAIGLAGAFALTRLMSGLLYGITPSDPATFVVVALLLIGVAAAACYVPARRATSVDPIVALRYE
jgi:predicted permease